MTEYQSVASVDPFSKDPRQSAAIPAPPGLGVDETTREFAREVPDLLPRFGLVTPWAVRRGDTQWVELTQPQDQNLELFRISDVALAQIFKQLYGLELPYLAVLTKNAPTQTEMQQAFEGATYAYLETHGVYAQTDKQLNPRVFYLHWLRRQAAGEGGKLSPERAAQRIGGTFLFAQQVPAAETSLRPAPMVSFADAQLKAAIKRLPPSGVPTQSLWLQQVGRLGDVPAAPAAAAPDYITPALVAGVGAVGAFLLLRGK